MGDAMHKSIKPPNPRVLQFVSKCEHFIMSCPKNAIQVVTQILGHAARALTCLCLMVLIAFVWLKVHVLVCICVYLCIFMYICTIYICVHRCPLYVMYTCEISWWILMNLNDENHWKPLKDPQGIFKILQDSERSWKPMWVHVDSLSALGSNWAPNPLDFFAIFWGRFWVINFQTFPCVSLCFTSQASIRVEPLPPA